MSCNYADGLSPYHDKGQLGLDEKFDSKSVVTAKVSLLTKWINEAKHVVIHTGAGISTSAGIPDFRGPRGVWTLEAKGEKPDLSTDFNEAIPTVTHMAITKLVEKGKAKYVVSQNIDGLHLRSNLSRKYLSELHGNMFIEQCNHCHRQFVRSGAVPTVGQKSLNKPCPTLKPNGRPCRGKLHDCILDWEHNLPENDLGMADYHSCMSDLSICLGTTMQIVPSGNLPLYTKKHGGKLVICNLQPTKHDRKADLLIHTYVDEIMTMLMKNLNLKIPKYTPKNDPTKTIQATPDTYMEWTISDYTIKKMKKVYEEKCGTKEARKRLEMIDDDLPLSIAQNLKRKRSKEEDDSDLEVLDVIVNKGKKGSDKEPKKRGPKPKNKEPKELPPPPSPTITVKKISPVPPKKQKYEGEKIVIKKNVTPTKTKYEIVPAKPKKSTKCEIVYCTDSDVCNDLEMICESDDDDNPNFTYNFKLYLQDGKGVKKEEEDKDVKKVEEVSTESSQTEKKETETEVKEEVKTEESDADASQDKTTRQDEKKEDAEKEKSGSDTEVSKSNEGKNEKEAAENMDTDNAEIVDQESAEKVDQENVEKPEKETVSESEKSEIEKPDAEKIETSNVGETEMEKIDEPEKSNLKESDEERKKLDEESKGEKQDSVNESQISTNQKENDSVEKMDVSEAEVSQVEVNADNESNKTTAEQNKPQKNGEEDGASEINKLINDADIQKEADKANVEEKDSTKEKNLYSNIESELSNLNTNIDNAIDQLVNPPDASPFDNSLQIPDCSINNPISENYNFYNSEYNASSGQADLDFVGNNYYNNF